MALDARPRNDGPVAAINVTPMADIMIVLLVIFMVMTPFFDRDPHLRLPAMAHSRPATTPVKLALRADATVVLGQQRFLHPADLLGALRARLDELPREQRIVRLSAHEDLPYAKVLPVLDVCRQAGAEELAFIGRPRVDR